MIHENQQIVARLNIISDGVIVLVSFLLGWWIRFSLLSDGIVSVPFRTYCLTGVLLIPLHLLTYAAFHLYESHRKTRLYQEAGQLLCANVLDFAILQTVLFLFKSVNFSRKALFFFLVLNCLLLCLKRLVMRTYLHRIRADGKNQKSIIIAGSGQTARNAIDTLRRETYLGYAVSGYLADTQAFSDVPYLGSFAQTDGVLMSLRPDEVIAGFSAEEYARTPELIRACEHSGTKLSLIPFYAQYLPAHPQMDSLNGIPLVNLRRIPLDNLVNAFMKRTIDILGSLALIVLTSPLMLFTAIGVRLSSPGPIIFRQNRVGLDKKEFQMYKFRSMRVNAASDTAWSTDTDPRKTKFGTLIRKCSIDELPQFFNVLRGDMSLVGPRPEIPFFVNQFKDEIPLYMVKHQVRPGITGWAQVNGLRGDTSIRDRIEYDIYYIENWNLLFDLKILFMTVFKSLVNKEH